MALNAGFHGHVELGAGAEAGVGVGDRRVGDARAGVAAEVAGDEAHERAAVGRRQQHEVVAGDGLVAGRA